VDLKEQVHLPLFHLSVDILEEVEMVVGMIKDRIMIIKRGILKGNEKKDPNHERENSHRVTNTDLIRGGEEEEVKIGNYLLESFSKSKETSETLVIISSFSSKIISSSEIFSNFCK